MGDDSILRNKEKYRNKFSFVYPLVSAYPEKV